MKDDVVVKNGIVIPAHELEITTSRAGGPGGQHVNKTSTRITVRWNLFKSIALNSAQKELVAQKLQSSLTSEGDVIVHNSASRSQLQNKQSALDDLAKKIRQALYVPKKRMKTRVPAGAQQARLESKKKRASVKEGRSKRRFDE